MNRRTFLKLTAATGIASALPLQRGLALASTLTLAAPHHHFPNPEALLAADLSRFDLLLLPAYAAAELIARGALQQLDGLPQRPHDPEGAFTIPYGHAVAALVSGSARSRSIGEFWRRLTRWPDDPRLVIGAALLRRGYSPNDTHPGHLAQIEADLLKLRPRVVRDPVTGLRARAGEVALTWIPPEAGMLDPSVTPLPIVVEYDWAIPLTSAYPARALDFISAIGQRPSAASSRQHARPLALLPPSTRALHAAIWNQVVA